jgi:PAS domain S-box-containing protein
MLGTERTKLLLKRLAHFIDDADQDDWHHLMQSIQQDETEPEQTADLIFKRNDGIKLNVQLNCLRMNEQCEPQVLRISLTDITELKQAEAAMRIAARAFEAQEGIIITDANKLILRVNQAFTELTGYSAQEVIGRTPNVIGSARQDASFYSEMWDGINTTDAWEGEIWDRRKSGEIFPARLSITAVRDDYHVITNYVATIIDVTQRKAAESEIRTLGKRRLNRNYRQHISVMNFT